MAVVNKRLTLQEFLALPEEEPALEYEEGVVRQKPMPKRMHSWLQLTMCELFNQAGKTRKLFLAFPELRFTLRARSYVPDVAVYIQDRIPVDENGELFNDAPEPPDVTVEIVSPEQSVTALVRKCIWYVENGGKAALLVDPRDRTVLLFHAGQAYQALREEDAVDLGDILPGFQTTVSEIFGALKVR